jgi:thiamine-phosphate pyrophosphorylase
LACADSLVDLARPSNTSIIVNDRVDVAKLSGASGVHVGQDDLSVSRIRRILGNDAVIGLSTHCRSQVDLAVQESVAYIAVGPVFATRSKETGYQPVGLELVRYAARQWPQSIIVGIGGITLERAPSVIEAGANAVAVISDLLTDGDPERRTRAYLERLYQ